MRRSMRPYVRVCGSRSRPWAMTRSPRSIAATVACAAASENESVSCAGSWSAIEKRGQLAEVGCVHGRRAVVRWRRAEPVGPIDVHPDPPRAADVVRGAGDEEDALRLEPDLGERGVVRA